MPDIVGIELLKKKLDDLAKQAANEANKASVTVGYTQSYGLFVHENLEAFHPGGGQAKFLEEPARTLEKVLANIIARAMKRGLTMEQALLLAGLRLQRESQKIVPVDTGALKASAFTAITSEANEKAQEAFERAKAIFAKKSKQKRKKHKR